MLLIAACGCGTKSKPEGQGVQASAGGVRGEVDGEHVLFAGIPDAAPPLNQLRWRAPQPTPKWDGIRDATKYGPSCPQEPPKDEDADLTVSEDCLTLNVW